MRSFILGIVAILLCVCSVLADQTYSKSLDITGAGFYDEFSFFASADPTHGRVYVFHFHPRVACSNSHLFSVNTSINRLRNSTTLPMLPNTLSSYALTTKRISRHPILAENQSAFNPINSSQPLSPCTSAELFIKLFITSP